jgi:hypothetical protein
MEDLEAVREILEEKTELIREAFYYLSALEEGNYTDSDDEDKLNEELDKLLKELGIELEYGK